MTAGRVAALEAAIEGHVRAIFDAALAAPPGGGKPWDGLLAHYGVAADPPRKRLETASNLKMARGATPDEVTRALEGLAAWAKGQVATLASDPTSAAEPRFSAVMGRIAMLAVHDAARYREMVAPKPSPTVASIFANAAATGKDAPWNHVIPVDAVILACSSCGAPQEAAGNFQCRYCGGRLGH